MPATAKLLLSFLIAIGLVLASCSFKKKPEDVLRNFIQYRFSGDQDKEKILSYTTGPFKQSIQDMDEKTFEEFAMGNTAKSMQADAQTEGEEGPDTKWNLKKLKVGLSNCQETKCHITYTIRYEQMREGKTLYVTEVKKIAELWKEDEKWRIADLDDVKTYIDSVENIGVSSEGEAVQP